jgi:DNA-binding response OmpR family regulator
MVAAMMRSGFISWVARTLIVSGDDACLVLLSDAMKGTGFDLTQATNIDQAVGVVRDQLLDLVIMDYNTDPDGTLAFCRKMRRDPQTCGVTIVMIGSVQDDREVVNSLWVGADGFIEQPVTDEMLVAQVKCLLRRYAASACSPRAGGSQEPSAVQVGDLLVDPRQYEAYLGGHRLGLTVSEFRILYLLASRPGRTLTRDDILQSMHGTATEVSDRTVDSRVHSLRRKLGDDQKYIETVRSVGYRMASQF